jgi:hypothetical protein
MNHDYMLVVDAELSGSSIFYSSNKFICCYIHLNLTQSIVLVIIRCEDFILQQCMIYCVRHELRYEPDL